MNPRSHNFCETICVTLLYWQLHSLDIKHSASYTELFFTSDRLLDGISCYARFKVFDSLAVQKLI